MLRKILLILGIAMLTACSNNGQQMTSQQHDGRIRTNLPENTGNGVTLDQFAKVHDFYNSWEGVRYRMGGTTKNGIDCSAFVLNVLIELLVCRCRAVLLNSVMSALKSAKAN